jgi:hypothetical protein
MTIKNYSAEVIQNESCYLAETPYKWKNRLTKRILTDKKLENKAI